MLIHIIARTPALDPVSRRLVMMPGSGQLENRGSYGAPSRVS
jgi:hypothetical protein